ncbi:inovirus-type Gp2 protein [Acinetobacter soli]|uniref:YagK/YfjJ domain-containing protein n=1 Tax=Acinetobacter soli TaxID=487316 RepID=UPI003218ABCD
MFKENMSNLLNESKVLIQVESISNKILTMRRQSKVFYSELKDSVIDFSEIYNPEFYYSASISPFIDLLLDIQEYLHCPDLLLERLSEIQFKHLQQDFKKHKRLHRRQLRDHRYSESKNREQLIRRMERVSQRYARILVVRVDLAYALKSQDMVDIQRFNDDMHVLRTRIRDQDKMFRGLIEYAWALEQGIDKGYHCHLLLVYRGHERRKAYGIADQIGKLWKQITKDLGCYFNCHDTEYLRQFSERNMLGIGMIYRNDSEQVRQMLRTVSYLVNPEKQDQYLRVKCSKRMRSFG